MKGLPLFPSLKIKIKALNSLQGQAFGEALFIKYFPLCRFDSRIAEVFIKNVSETWKTMDPIKLNSSIHNHPWFASVGVLLDMASLLMTKKDLRVFKVWTATVMHGAQKAKGEVYFVAILGFASTQLRRQITYSLKIYRRWGYYGEDFLINKSQTHHKHTTLMRKNERLSFLREWAPKDTFFSVRDYKKALNGCVSTRTAEMDLKNASFIKSIGTTKGKRYSLKR